MAHYPLSNYKFKVVLIQQDFFLNLKKNFKIYEKELSWENSQEHCVKQVCGGRTRSGGCLETPSGQSQACAWPSPGAPRGQRVTEHGRLVPRPRGRSPRCVIGAAFLDGNF